MSKETKTKYQILNELNEKYNVYEFAITCYDEAEEFYNVLSEVHRLSIPAIQVENKDMEKVVYIYENWNKIA